VQAGRKRAGPARALAGAVAVLLAVAPAAGAARAPDIHADPPLRPAFARDIPDYAVRCERVGHVRISVRAPAGTRVSIDGGPKRSGAFSRQPRLAPGQQVAFAVDEGGRSRTHHVRCLPDDFPRTEVMRTATPSHALYLLTPSPWVAIFDARGVPVWWRRAGIPVAQDAELLGDETIAWFPSRNPFLGAPDGLEVHRLDGSLARRVRAWQGPGEPIATDIHEVQRLAGGDYLMAGYRRRAGRVDLSPCGGPSDATVVDGEVQRIRPGRAKPVWVWSTRDHVALSESSRWCALSDIVPLPDGSRAYDIVHLNSLQLTGNALIVAMRHTDAAYEVDYRTGAVVWKLGGTSTPQSLEIVGDERGGSSFGGPHFARQDRPPRAVRYRIDEAARTATLVEEVADPRAKRAICCGSAQRLGNGNWLMSWGANRIVTELSPAGAPLFTLRLGPHEYSYRVFPIERGRLARHALRAGMDAMHPRG
jgi:hypothetical protein